MKTVGRHLDCLCNSNDLSSSSLRACQITETRVKKVEINTGEFLLSQLVAANRKKHEKETNRSHRNPLKVIFNLMIVIMIYYTLPNITLRAVSKAHNAQQDDGDQLEFASSNFTSFIADRDTNMIWPAQASISRLSQSSKGKSSVPRNSLKRVSPSEANETSTPIEVSFFESPVDGGGDTSEVYEYDDDDDEEEDEDEAYVASLLGGKENLLLPSNEEKVEVNYEAEPDEEEEFYNKNPVDTIDWSLEKAPHEESAREQSNRGRHTSPATQEKSKPKRTAERIRKFDDFDDIEALRLKSFYDKPKQEVDELRDWNHKTLRARKHNTGGDEKKFDNENERASRKEQSSKRVFQRQQAEGRERRSKRKRRGRRKKKFSNGSKSAASSSAEVTAEQQVYQVPEDAYSGGDGAQCALITQSGACLRYNSVEWALRRARRLLEFRRPSRASLSSLEPSEATINAVGELIEWTSRMLALRYGLSVDEIALGLEQLDVRRTSLWRTCPRLFRSPAARRCYTLPAAAAVSATDRAFLLSGRYRTYTGLCNNPLVAHYGSSFMPFVRLNAPEYDDGLGLARGASSLNGGGAGASRLPPARVVSLNLHPAYEAPSSDHSAMFAAWGQLMNHDLASTSGARASTGHDGSCCARLTGATQQSQAQTRLSNPLTRVCMPILIGLNDPIYAPHGVRCHDFKRSLAGVRPGCSLGPRAQVNLVTSFVDASFVYGSTRSLGESLRSNVRRGQLAMWYYFGTRRLPLLPPQLEAPDDECVSRPRGLYCFRSGDSRTNQQVPLVALHTIHARQHNRLASALAQLNPHWSSERLFAEARHIHVAQIQHILLSEYLPELLGPSVSSQFQLDEASPDVAGDGGGYWDNYDASHNPGISQEFAAAAFRQGHSSVPSRIYRVDPLTRAPTRRAYNLRELFRRPWPLFEPGALDEFLAGLVDTPTQEVDPFVSRELTAHLMQEPDEPVGLDLIAINIQRGRDHGVASYNSMRDWCGLGRLAHFGELARVVGNASAQIMAALYESVDDIDLYTGGLSELPLEGAQLGATFACIVGHQFSALRRADRLWFESSAGPHAFSPAQLAAIKRVPLARIVCANSDQLQYMQPLAMRLPHPIYNPLVTCNELPDLDLSLWYEPATAAAGTQAPPSQGEDEEEDENK